MPSRLEEASEASKAYQAALASIGLQATVEALNIWRDNTPEERNRDASAWLATAVAMVMRRRAQAQDLAVAYYRLARALLTGTTIPKPSDPAEPRTVTLGVLRREFGALIGDDPAAPAIPSQSTPSAPAEAGPTDISVDLGEEASDDELVREERLDEGSEDSTNLAVAREEVASALQSLGSRNLAKKNKALDPSEPATKVDAERKNNAAQAGARQAASASRMVKNGARKTVFELHERDSKALGYIRVSTTGTPCGFCAMLISRGPVYKSEKAAGYGEGNLFHDNCVCIAIPVWSDEQFNDDPQFALNHLYAEQWPQVTRGLSGKAALTAWRRFIRQEQARQPDAQAA